MAGNIEDELQGNIQDELQGNMVGNIEDEICELQQTLDIARLLM